MKVTFITGNQAKADFLSKHVGYPIKHRKIDLDEIQSLDLTEVAEFKARQAFKAAKSPVLVEDVAMVFEALGKLPGPFIKWFEVSLGLEKICRLLDGKSRAATAKVCFVYFDGAEPTFFNGSLNGQIAQTPKGENGFGFDPIFIPSGHSKTLAEMTDAGLETNSLRTTTVYPEIRRFLGELDKAK